MPCWDRACRSAPLPLWVRGDDWRAHRGGPQGADREDTAVAQLSPLPTGAVLGTDPQDLKYEGERTLLEVGAPHGDSRIRHPEPGNGGLGTHRDRVGLPDYGLLPMSRTTAKSATMSSSRCDQHGRACPHRGLGDREWAGLHSPIRAHRRPRLHRRQFAGSEGCAALLSRGGQSIAPGSMG